MKMRVPINIPVEHPAFAGHFPGIPILPAVVLLDETLRAIAAARNIDLSAWQIASVKFHSSVSPGDIVHLEHEPAPRDSLRFSLSVGERAVAAGLMVPR